MIMRPCGKVLAALQPAYRRLHTAVTCTTSAPARACDLQSRALPWLPTRLAVCPAHPLTRPMRPASLPALQPEEREALSHFPPRSLPHLVAQRDVLLSYAEANPVRHPSAGHCWRQRVPEIE